MSWTAAILVVAAAVAAFLIDRTWFESAGIIFIGKGLFDITEFLAFWR